jgi:hypothetical protein
MTRNDRTGGLRVAALASFLIVLSPFAVRADEGDDAAARALFGEGRNLAAAGDYAAACPKFEASFKLDPGIGTNFNLADCEEHLGHTASAWMRFLSVAAATKAAGQPDRERVARARAAALESRLSRLIVNVPSPPPDIVVRRDEVVIPPTLWGGIVAVDPGEHVIEAAAPGKRPWSTKVTIATSPDPVSVDVPSLEDAPVALKLDAAQPRTTTELAKPGLVAPGPVAPEGGASKIPEATLWLGAVGVVALGAGAVFEMLSYSADQSARGLCLLPPNHTTCKDSSEYTIHTTLENNARGYQLVAIVSASAGAASVAAAGAWWWRASHKTPAEKAPTEARITAHAMLTSGGMAMGIEGLW